MIQLPKRSVTRFFIPLIDVLTLLFCIYLIMPLVSKPGDGTDGSPASLEEQVRELRAELEKREREGKATDQLRHEVEELRKEKIETLKNRLLVRVLEIDGQTGRLYSRDLARELQNEADARELIDRDRNVGKEVYYLVLYPRDPRSDYPTQEQRRRYDQWFQGVAVGYDIPGKEGRP